PASKKCLHQQPARICSHPTSTTPPSPAGHKSRSRRNVVSRWKLFSTYPKTRSENRVSAREAPHPYANSSGRHPVLFCSALFCLILKTVDRCRNSSFPVHKRLAGELVHRHHRGISKQTAELHGITDALADHRNQTYRR